MQITLIKKSDMKTFTQKKLIMAKKGASAPAAFILIDNENDTCTVMGTDAAGNFVDISAVATLTPPPTSDAPTIVTVTPPGPPPANPMNFAFAAVGPLGTANITATATWNDAASGIGPFSFTLPVTVQAGGPTGIVIVPGTPSIITNRPAVPAAPVSPVKP